ncbi:hypothetical protein EV122DRAFT_259004 [Schizophyllum commune]
MDVAPHPPPRLRVSRNPPFLSRDLPSMPGPSSADPATFPDRIPSHHDDDGDWPTSRIPAPYHPPSANGRSPDAMRLRDLLDQTSGPSSSDARPVAPAPRSYPPSELESDYDDIPNFGGGPSLARESLKALFNSALADTPERTRRSNVTTSDMDMSPGPSKPMHQRNWSMSDDGSEDAEAPPASLRPTPGRRQANGSPVDDKPTPRPELKNLLVSDTESDDTAAPFPRHPNTAKASPPENTNTPFHSIHLSPNESNLTDQDSDMQRAMQDYDSYIASANNSPMTFPSSRKQAERLPPTTPSNRTGESEEQKTARRPKMTIENSLDRLLQRSSRQTRDDHDNERPLSRNKPAPRSNPPTTPALKRRSVNLTDFRSSPPVTNGHSRTLTRRTSSNSLQSDMTSPGSSRRGSVMSNQDYAERRQSMAREDASEREKSWNKPRPRSDNLSHFNLSQLDERSRALSSPSRPGSSMSLTFEHQVRSRHRLSTSSSFGDLSSRSVSPSNSMFSVDEEREEIMQAVEHERERNWGNSRPQWRARKLSETLLSSRPPSPADSLPDSPQISPSLLRRRTESLRNSTASPAGLRKSPSSASLRASPSIHAPLRSPSPSPGHRSRRTSLLQTNASSPGFPASPSKTPSTVRGKQKAAPVDISDFSTGSARSTPGTHTRTYSTPARPSSRLSLSSSPGRVSHIPVYSPGKKKKAVPVPKPVVPEEENLSVDFPSSSSARQLPKIEVSTSANGFGDSATSSDAEDNATPRVVEEENTPTLKTVLPPAEETPRASPVDERRSSPHLRPATNDEARLQRTIGSPLSVESSIERSTTPPLPPPQPIERSTTPPSPPLPSSPGLHGSPEIPTSPELPSSPALSASPPPRPPSRTRASPAPRAPSPKETPRAPSPRQSSRPPTPKQTSRPPTPREPSRPSTPRDAPRPPTPRESSRPSTPRDAPRPPTPKESQRPSTPKEATRPPTPRETPRPVSPRPPSRSTTPAPAEVSMESEGEQPFVSLPANTPEQSVAFTIPDPSLLSSTGDQDHTPERHFDSSVLNTPANGAPNWSSIATPRPPGAWLATPAPIRRTRANSLPTQTDPDESSKSSISPATPAASMGRASAYAFQTPAPPGAYVPTPAARKSILKVRFDPAASSARPATGDWSESFEQSSDMLDAGNATPRPESAPPMRSPGMPRIRMLDAYGRPLGAQADTPRKPLVRIVDASGEEIKHEESLQFSVTEEEDEPQTHNEALKRVRRDVVDLNQQFDEMEVKREESSEELQRLRELEQVSQESRQRREKLAQDLHTREQEFKAKFAQQREAIERSHAAMTASIRRPPAWTPRVWMTLLAVQLFVAVFIYKYAHMRAEELFLTTYYDTFYGDFYLPDPPDSPRYAIPSRVTWFYQHHQDGWRSFLSDFWRYLCLFVMDVQSYVRDRWLRQEPSHLWPPT